MGKKVYEMDRLMRNPEGKLLAQVTDYEVKTVYGKAKPKQVKGKNYIDFNNLPRSASNIHVRIPKYGAKDRFGHRRAVAPNRGFTREQVIKDFTPW